MSKNNYLVLGNTGFVGKPFYIFRKKIKNKAKILGFGSKKIDLSIENKAKNYLNLSIKNLLYFFFHSIKTQRNAKISDLEKNLDIIKNFNKIISLKTKKKNIF